MKNAKRLFSAFLVLVLIFGMLPMPAAAEEAAALETIPETTAPAETVRR